MRMPLPKARLRRIGRILLVAVLVLLAGLGSYVGYAALRATRSVTLPAPTGPYRVGRAIAEWTDHARADPLAPPPGGPRRLSVWLWYPAEPVAGAETAPYAPGAWTGLHLGGALAWSETKFEDVRVHAIADVPVAAGRFPVVVLEPGMGFAAPQYTTIAEDLASHGYLVVGVTPTYSANLTVLGGTTVQASEAGNPSVFDGDDLHTGQAQAAGDRLVRVWADDARFAAAQVLTQSAFTGHLDTTKTIYIGHSFGGAAALEACRSDPYCAGAADLDGTQYGTVVHSGLAKPLMFLGSQDSCITGTCAPATPADRSDRAAAQSLLNAGSGPVWCYRIAGTEHFNFTDYAAYYLAAPTGLLLALGPADGDVVLTITGAYLSAFADRAVSGRPQALLAAPSPYSQVEVQRTIP
ncbi:alpha/beta hydrolase [Amycolatopsis sp., V23-08]|uniref:Alpha/beta hydrolase n=1 Tax=Amycolatopsis heterodermiae TaxID=3110235 RepID=A0ABU5RA31_9PSEU|nr:alpha/beta hydrolase [Amycolatopsis sp., V23-08]MEA5362988.1 alpha/beta hydrolase [Amycolatopsis sp., V23-08]